MWKRANELAKLILRDESAALRATCDAARAHARSRNPFENEAQLAQWLVLQTSQRYEQEQERRGSGFELSQELMVIRFVKFLVQRAARRSLLDLCVATTRLNYRYDKGAMQRIFDILSPNPDSLPGDAYFRARKRLLLEQVSNRFGDRIQVVKAPPWGEDVILSWDPAQHELVNAALHFLEVLTTWHTSCPIDDSWDPDTHVGVLRQKGCAADMRRRHVLIHPGCFAKLTETLGLPPPRASLSIPRFELKNDRGQEPG